MRQFLKVALIGISIVLANTITAHFFGFNGVYPIALGVLLSVIYKPAPEESENE